MTDQQSKSVWVVIPAAGSGQRMQSVIPKQYLEILDKSVIEHTLDCFLNHPEIMGVVVVVSEEDQYWKSLKLHSCSQAQVLVESKCVAETFPNKASLHSVNINVHSDSIRSDTVMRGLKFLRDDHGVSEDSWVMVHDAARPCLSKSDVDALLGLRNIDCVGGILASPVRDTMKRAVEFSVSNNTADVSINNSDVSTENTVLSKTVLSKTGLSKTVSYTESRENLWHALTPQMFQLGGLSEALEYCKAQGMDVTDECSAMENSGCNPVIVEGSHNNIKVTYPSDLELATFFLSNKH